MENFTIYSHNATIFAAASACVLIIFGVIGNSLTIVALLKSQKIRSHTTTLFVISLSLSDLLFCSFNLPLTATRFFERKWSFGSTLCKIFPVIFYGNVAVSLLSMIAITLNRYILIACQSFYSKIYKPPFIYLQLLFVWMFSFSLLVPPLLGIWGEMGLDKATFSCTILKKNGKSIKKSLFLIGFVLPCLVIIASYSCIYLKVFRQRRKVTAHNLFAISINQNKVSSARKYKEDNKLTIMMMIIFICFLLCFLPLMLANVVDDERNTSYPWFHILSSVMAWSSSVINPFIYAVSNRNYRVAYCKLLASLKFWDVTVSLMPSGSFHHSKNSQDVSRGMQSTPLSCGVHNCTGDSI